MLKDSFTTKFVLFAKLNEISDPKRLLVLEIDFASEYAVGITEQPEGYTCSVDDSKEKMPAKDVVVAVDCEISKNYSKSCM